MKIAERKGLGKFWIIRLDSIGIRFISIYDLIENPFIFYAVLPEFRNKGYMQNAIGLIEKEHSSILSTIDDAKNVRSIRVLTNTTIIAKKLYNI